jgi:hypothetical protein
MSEGCFKGWKWCEFQPDQIQSLGYYLVDDKLKPLGEPHPDQLKRCEVCKHNSAIAGVNTVQPYCIKLHEAGEAVTFPEAKTCPDWTWDEHDTKGES